MAKIESSLNSSNTSALIDFPCDFPLKVMGESQSLFTKTIVALIQTVLPEFDDTKIESKLSSTGKYTSLTCIVHVVSQQQLDEIYRLISGHPLVKFSL